MGCLKLEIMCRHDIFSVGISETKIAFEPLGLENQGVESKEL
jgi:hypothetical protein